MPSQLERLEEDNRHLKGKISDLTTERDELLALLSGQTLDVLEFVAVKLVLPEYWIKPILSKSVPEMREILEGDHPEGTMRLPDNLTHLELQARLLAYVRRIYACAVLAELERGSE